ncbi:MAG: DUF512 domain-containing protein [Coriobacteriales bacterium]
MSARDARGADYAPSSESGTSGGRLSQVDEGSVAYEAGLRAGMIIDAVDGQPLRDLVDWYWLSADDSITVSGTVPEELAEQLGADGAFEYDCDLEREPGQEWGVTFAEAVFDGMRLCVNDCLFCFMRMLPRHMRRTLYLPDDDYRLSFLQGNFVTLTNMTDADVERVVRMRISPLHVSVHAVDHDVRRRLIGANEARGLSVLEQLLDAGIECHAQVVLVPGINDGSVLEQTLRWLEERDGVLSCSIVPVGYTSFQSSIAASFDEAQAAGAVIDLVEPFQRRSRDRLGVTRFHLADEFYLNASRPLPEARDYDGFGQYEDGIGMVRSFMEEWTEFWEQAPTGLADRVAASDRRAHLLTGASFAPILRALVSCCPIGANVEVHAVENAFFGGNVDVTGLLTGQDLAAAVRALPAEDGAVAFVPDVVFNADGVTLDDCTADDIARRAGRETRVLSCNVDAMLAQLIAYLTEDA